MDPSTAIITALAAGAAAAAKETASDTVKDLYKGLKDLLSKHLTTLPRLERNPTGKAQEAAVEELSETSAKDDPAVARAAANLAEAVAREANSGSVAAIDLKKLRIAGEALIQGNVGGVVGEDIEAGSLKIVDNSRGN